MSPTTIPAVITNAQKQAAIRAFGIPASLVCEITLHATEGVRAELFLRDREGRIVSHGGDPLTTTLRIPYGEVSADAAA
ncbi:hypothetical protein [Streptomyces catenulae]|uniref:Uncharacterized protein n=1 Tax=Streptomyces catenulae TaxID=66875 RepID=A0ABV2Z4J3_9ACTN|nr:hypothetical protein [Streptomyces catenulae]